jgi:hypothetical protein
LKDIVTRDGGRPGRRRNRLAVLVAGLVALAAVVALAALVAGPNRPPVPSPDGPAPTGTSSSTNGAEPTDGPTDGTTPEPGTSAPASPIGTPTASPLEPTGQPSGPPGLEAYIALVELASEDPGPGGTFVILANDGAAPADVGCWRLVTSRRDDLTIASGTQVPAGGGLRLFFDRGDVANPDRLELRDETGRVIDATPELHDTAGDDRLFGRTGDRWTLGRPALPQPVIDVGFDPTGC